MTTGQMRALLLAAWAAGRASDDGRFTAAAVAKRLRRVDGRTAGARLSILENMGLVGTPRHGPASQGRRWELTDVGRARVEVLRDEDDAAAAGPGR